MSMFVAKPLAVVSTLRGQLPRPSTTLLAAYAVEFRRAMIAARRVERMSGNLDKAARLLQHEYRRRDV